MKLKTALTVLFFVVLAILLIAVANTRSTSMPSLEFSISSLTRGLGAMIALAAGLLLLLRAASRDSLASMTPLILPLVAGLLLIHPHWSLGLVLAVVVAGVLLRDLLPASNNGGSNPPRRFRRSSGGGGGREREREQG